jgi:hypothetical protein
MRWHGIASCCATISVTIGALGYRARCTEAGCGNLARLGLRHADTGGRPMLLAGGWLH